MKQYRFTFTVVGSDMRNTVFDTVADSVQDLVITQIEDTVDQVALEVAHATLDALMPLDRPALYRKGDPISTNYASRGCARVLMEFAREGEFDSSQAAARVKDRGYNPNSASATLTRLARLGLIERTNPGHRPFRYNLTPPKGFIVDGADDGHN